MKRTDFFFDLPPALIAQEPLAVRDQSRLMCLNRRTGEVQHRLFSDLPTLLLPGDCLVLNNSRVLPARLMGTRSSGATVETLLLRDLGDDRWECLTRPGKKTRPGTHIFYGEKDAAWLEGVVEAVAEDGKRIVHFQYEGIFLERLEQLGNMPLPPYIKKWLEDPERYQTVYAKTPGSAAAPTAGLHFTPALLDTLCAQGVEIAYITLHVGLGTFRPVKELEVENHIMHEEYCEISAEAAEKINRARRDGHRVICVGTTSCRTLESFAQEDGTLQARAGFTDIFIRPGYQFKCMDGLITNFHLPESTLLMLVSAFAGREAVLDAYRQAVEERYRFFSFGDAMWIA